MSEHPGKRLARMVNESSLAFMGAEGVQIIASYVSDLELRLEASEQQANRYYGNILALRARLEKAEAERELQPMSGAPKDGTPVLCFCNMADYPFIAHFGHVGRYTSTPKMWIGHEFGAMSDADIIGWMPLPKPALKSSPPTPPQGDEA